MSAKFLKIPDTCDGLDIIRQRWLNFTEPFSEFFNPNCEIDPSEGPHWLGQENLKKVFILMPIN